MSQSDLNDTPNPNSSGLIPNSIVRANRYELTDLKLHIEPIKPYETLPQDLQGHFFVVAPVGSVNSGGLPTPSSNSILSGDGMIFRLDFDKSDQVNVKTRLAKPPDYYADLATRPGSKYEKYGFNTHGIARFSLSLGIQNQLNTAFLPMPFSDDDQQRLLVTYDVGRHYEIDTETLETVTPVGANTEWQSELQGLPFPFQPFLSTAHPVFDPATDEMFTVNYGRSLENLLNPLPLSEQLEQLPQEIEKLIASMAGFSSAEVLRDLFGVFGGIFNNLSSEMGQLLENISGLDIENFVYLCRWNGKDDLERWKLVLPDGSPVDIKQTMHQMELSRDYIVLMDTAFVAGLAQVVNNPFPNHKEFEQTLIEVLQKPPNPDTQIYIVRRQDLKRGQYPALGESEVEVVAKPLTIPMEAAHFLMDYDNPEGQITLHIAHICAWNVAEWIRQLDVSPYNHSYIAKQLQGMVVNELDIGRFGRYVIDGEKPEIVQSQVIAETPYTWANGLYAYLQRKPPDYRYPPNKLENIYWCSFGLWPELMTEYGIRFYQDYKYRAIPINQILELAKERVPSCLFRIDTTNMIIADSYEMPKGMVISSPQFIPSQNSEGESTNGYLLCTVYTAERNEFWLFDGTDLSKGPICKLYHPSLSFGFTLHTAWLPSIGPRKADYNIPVSLDYQELVNQQGDPKIKELFEQEIYPHFED